MPPIILFSTLPSRLTLPSPTETKLSLKFLLAVNFLSLSGSRRRSSVDLACPPLAGLSHTGGDCRGSPGCHRALQPPTAGSRRAGTRSAQSRHATALVATLVTQGRGQWGSHWRRHGQRRRLWRLRQHHQLLGTPSAPALLDIRLASVTSVYGGAPTQLSPHLTPLPCHPDRARWRKLHSFRQEDL